MTQYQRGIEQQWPQFTFTDDIRSSDAFMPFAVMQVGSSDGTSTSSFKDNDIEEREQVQDLQTGAALRAQKIKEKNKKAQKKFREKTKERSTMLAEQALQLEQQLECIQAEKKALEDETRVLQRLSDNLVIPSAAPAAPEDEPFVASLGITREVNPFTRSDLILDACFMPPVRLTYKQAIRLSLEDHKSIFTAMCDKLRKLLPLCTEKLNQKEVTSAAGRQVQALILEQHGFMAYMSAHQPKFVHQISYLRGLRQGQPNTPGHWANILRRMELTQEQKRYISQTRYRYLAEQDRILLERQELQKLLMALNTAATEYTESKLTFGKQHHQWAQVTQALRENVDREHIACCFFFAQIWMLGLLSPAPGLTVFQEARAYVDSWPWYPDMEEILVLLEVEYPKPPLILDAELHISDNKEGLLPDPTAEQYRSVDLKLFDRMFASKLSLAV